jgi:hypothetical protein
MRAHAFVHPLCSYCKVEVTSIRSATPKGGWRAATAMIVQVARPYLEPMFVD